MLKLERKLYSFRVCEIWFAEQPFDVTGYDRVIFYATRKRVEDTSLELKQQPTNVISLASPLDEIWKSFDKKSTRYAIRRAMRESVDVRIDSDHDEFFAVYNRFASAKKIASIDHDQLPKQGGKLFTVWSDATLLVGHFYYCDKPIIRLRFTASALDRGVNRTLLGCFSRYLHWQAIQLAKSSGYTEFDLGGLDLDPRSQRYSITRYKLSFGGTIVNKYTYVKDYSDILRTLALARRTTKRIVQKLRIEEQVTDFLYRRVRLKNI